jgi:hypothetical protein
MRKISVLLCVVCVCFSVRAQLTYAVSALDEQMPIDGRWDKPQWSNIAALKIEKRMGEEPRFRPATEAKVRYDAANVYVIFRVRDKYVKSTVTTYNGHVSGDSCVEFFFAPDANKPLQYFNLEVNAGGTPLIFFITNPWTDYVKLPDTAIARIEIAHSLPDVVDPEIADEVTWTIEYKIPLDMLKGFTNVTMPAPGVSWKANFYKTGSNTSNPHYYTWSPVSNPVPNFHLPAFFGRINFN